MRNSFVPKSKASWRIKTALLAVFMLTVAALALHFSRPLTTAKAAAPRPSARSLAASSLSLPMFFEPNQGQTDSRVKFLARGSGYGLFLTANEAVLTLNRPALKGQPPAADVIRMHLAGIQSAATVHGVEPLPGKSNYFIGNNPAKWHTDVPQFARIEYQNVYPGIDLAYYGNQRQLEYDFRVAPGAEPDRIALNFDGASAQLVSGDLVLSTSTGEVRFHAPHIYQSGPSGQTTISGSFRQLAGNKIGFSVGPYDHSRELVIDPVLSYATYLGGTGTESLVQVAVGLDFNVYLAGSTTSTDFPITSTALQSTLLGAQNIFIVKLNPAATPPSAQLVYATYLGGSGQDSLGGVAVDPNTGTPNIYVAGTTTSSNFPTSSNAFQQTAAGTHGFVTRLDPTQTGTAQLIYSSYLAGNGTDSITGLAVDSSQNAYVTGVTNSTNNQSSSFPANPNGYQLTSNSPGNNQFFATMVSTTQSGTLSIVYSTYFGGSSPPGATVTGGGIAVDPNPNAGSKVNLYFTGATNATNLPLANSFQTCLNQPGVPNSTQANCSSPPPNPSDRDVILVKLNPNQLGPASLIYSTYLGGSQDDVGTAVSVDSLSNAYVTGSTNSGNSTATIPDWNCVSPCVTGPYPYGNGAPASSTIVNGFIAKVINQTSPNTVFPETYFTYLGGSTGPDSGQSIVADSVGAAHVAGSAFSSNLPVTAGAPQPTYGGGGDAFAAVVSTSSIATGNYVTYLGGSQLDQGTGVAIDLFNSTYVAGATSSTNFPIPSPSTAYQPNLNGSAPDAFVAKLGPSSGVTIAAAANSPSPDPVAAGTQVAFIFDLTNNGPDTANNVTFYATVPTVSVAKPPQAIVTSGGNGTCTAPVPNGTGTASIVCTIGPLPVSGVGIVEVDETPAIPVAAPFPYATGQASVNGGPVNIGPITQSSSNVVNFALQCPAPVPVTAGALATISITAIPQPTYTATITLGETSSPAIVTAPAPTFTNPTITLNGTANGTSQLNIQTVARPVSTGSLFRQGPLYATWLPIGGLSLAGLGFGIRRKRGRWIAGAFFGLLVALILLQPACSTNSSSTSLTGGTAAGVYTFTITGNAGNGASNNCQPALQVN